MKNIGLSYLKVLLTLFVVLHHSILAYTTGGYGAAIDDPDNFDTFFYIVTYFDQFFMYAFFFISGLFAYNSLKRKGHYKYFFNKLVKFGLIFLIGTYVINTTSMYFMELAKGVEWWVPFASLSTFWDYFVYLNSYLHLSFHLWFIWVLILFHGLFTLIDYSFPILFRRQYKVKSATISIIILVFIMTLGYLLLGSIFGYNFIQIFGPLNIQISRFIPYLVMFFFGVIIGKEGINNTFLKKDSKFGKYAYVWIGFGLLVSVITYLIMSINISYLGLFGYFGPMLAAVFGTLGYVALFNKIQVEVKLLSFLAKNALGIYVFHYGIVSIFQGFFFNVTAPTPAFIQAITVFVLATLFSLLITYLLRLIKPIKYII